MTRPAAAGVFALAAVFALLSAPASALITRVWVSGKGADVPSCGAVTTPCRTFQYVHDNIVAAGGEIDVLDSAGYGAITITKAISIVNDGIGTVGVPAPAGGTAIAINAGANDKIFLKGLTVSGFGAGHNGVYMTSGGALSVTKCVFRNLQSGIYIAPSGAMSFSISDTVASDNASYGVWVSRTSNVSASGAITGVEANNNGSVGVYVEYGNATLDHIVANGNAFGILSSSGNVLVSDTTVSNNTYGVASTGSMWLSRVAASGNQIGVYSEGGRIYSYGDNHIAGNSPYNTAGTVTVVSGN